jgi:3-deoxy-D-manno-octulosonic-acid transferase
MMLPRLYRAATFLLAPVVLTYLGRRCKRGKEDPLRLAERRGIAAAPRSRGPLLWIHAASVGEASSVLGLIERLLVTRPGLQILLTTGTVASARLMAERLPPQARHQYVPVDLPRSVARFLDHWRPDLALWVESELWPNLVLSTAERAIPMVLLNGRLSARSYRRWRWCPGLIRPMLAAFRLCFAQDEEQARRFTRLGAKELALSGDLKAAAPALPADHEELERLRREIGARPNWLAASTHAGEEEIAAAVHRLVASRHRGLLTIIAPRHPARGEGIVAMLRARGLATARRSAREPIAAETAVYLVDTLGELGLFYRLARIAFIGGSLFGGGGHNPFEAARLGCAVLHGPDMSNCAPMAAALGAAGAAETVGDAGALAGVVSALLADPERRMQRAAAGARAVAAASGVLDTVLARLSPWLDALAPEASRVEERADPRDAPRYGDRERRFRRA